MGKKEIDKYTQWVYSYIKSQRKRKERGAGYDDSGSEERTRIIEESRCGMVGNTIPNYIKLGKWRTAVSGIY